MTDSEKLRAYSGVSNDELHRIADSIEAKDRRIEELENSSTLIERTAQLIAHRACCGSEHDPSQGKFHGYCVVCGIPWPCEIAKPIKSREAVERSKDERSAVTM